MFNKLHTSIKILLTLLLFLYVLGVIIATGLLRDIDSNLVNVQPEEAESNSTFDSAYINIDRIKYFSIKGNFKIRYSSEAANYIQIDDIFKDSLYLIEVDYPNDSSIVIQSVKDLTNPVLISLSQVDIRSIVLGKNASLDSQTPIESKFLHINLFDESSILSRFNTRLLRVNLHDATKLKALGTTNFLALEGLGKSEAKLEELIVKESIVELRSNAKAEVNVKTFLDAQLFDESNLIYRGKPIITSDISDNSKFISSPR